MLPVQYVELLKSFLSDRLFRTKQEGEYSAPYYIVHTNDIPEMQNITVADFTELLSVSEEATRNFARQKLQDLYEKLIVFTPLLQFINFRFHLLYAVQYLHEFF